MVEVKDQIEGMRQSKGAGDRPFAELKQGWSAVRTWPVIDRRFPGDLDQE